MSERTDLISDDAGLRARVEEAWDKIQNQRWRDGLTDAEREAIRWGVWIADYDLPGPSWTGDVPYVAILAVGPGLPRYRLAAGPSVNAYSPLLKPIMGEWYATKADARRAVTKLKRLFARQAKIAERSKKSGR